MGRMFLLRSLGNRVNGENQFPPHWLVEAKADMGVMLGGIGLGPKGGPEPIGTIDVRAAPLHFVLPSTGPRGSRVGGVW